MRRPRGSEIASQSFVSLVAAGWDQSLRRRRRVGQRAASSKLDSDRFNKTRASMHDRRRWSLDAEHVGSTAWLQRLSTHQKDLETIDMLPIGVDGQFDPKQMKCDVAKLNRRLKRIDCFLINPRTKLMQYWDFGAMHSNAAAVAHDAAVAATRSQGQV